MMRCNENHDIFNKERGEIMEHYIEIILLLAPGFIAKETARILGDVRKKYSNLDQILNYFMYSIFSLIPILALFIFNDWDLKNLGKEPKQILLYISIAIGSGIIIGVLWQLLIKRIIKYIADIITIKLTGYVYYQDKTISDSNLIDGNEHFVEVIRNGKRIAIGQFEGMSFGDDDNFIVKVNSHPVYAEWLDSEDWKEYFEHKCIYIDATHNIEIVEYYFPAAFFNQDFDINNCSNS